MQLQIAINKTTELQIRTNEEGFPASIYDSRNFINFSIYNGYFLEKFATTVYSH